MDLQLHRHRTARPLEGDTLVHLDGDRLVRLAIDPELRRLVLLDRVGLPLDNAREGQGLLLGDGEVIDQVQRDPRLG